MTAVKHDLLAVESHFQFGENWADYAATINPERIEVARASLLKLFANELTDKTFLDIGCGSGLFSLAALMLGARQVVAVDLDPHSVATTQQTLARFSPNAKFHVAQVSVFDLQAYLATETTLPTTFDIVYSWGVLHHTGDMQRALMAASDRVAPQGQFAVALYHRTLWRAEKRLFTRLPKFGQWSLIALYMLFYSLRHVLCTRQSLVKFIRNYKTQRGMSFYHDVKDWLGGYPYESISPQAFASVATKLKFSIVKQFLCGGKLGLFGAGCNEFVLQRRPEAA